MFQEEAGKLDKAQRGSRGAMEGLGRQTFHGEKFLGHHPRGPEKEVKGLTSSQLIKTLSDVIKSLAVPLFGRQRWKKAAVGNKAWISVGEGSWPQNALPKPALSSPSLAML